MNDKEYYKKLYFQLRDKLGRKPSSPDFYKTYNIHSRSLGTVFGSNPFTKLTRECGDIPNIFRKPKTPLEDILKQWGNLARDLKKIPTGYDWGYKKYRPSVQGICQSHKLKWSDIPNKFLEYAFAKPEWEDVIKLIPYKKEVTTETSTITPVRLDDKYYNYLPPIVCDLNELSVSEEQHNEFEKRVNLIFQMLGFEVEEYGQGTGRNPDGIAKDNQNHYAIIIDSKARSKGFKLGTEDRPIIEYIKKFKAILNRNGFQTIYFLIVSSSFENASNTSINNIKIETNTTTSFITANQLLKILAKKIESPRLFDLKEFQGLLIESVEITTERIDRFLSKIKE